MEEKKLYELIKTIDDVIKNRGEEHLTTWLLEQFNDDGGPQGNYTFEKFSKYVVNTVHRVMETHLNKYDQWSEQEYSSAKRGRAHPQPQNNNNAAIGGHNSAVSSPNRGSRNSSISNNNSPYKTQQPQRNHPSTVSLGDYIKAAVPPKKRVTPTKIHHSASSKNGRPFNNSPAFGDDNNILKLSEREIDNKDQCSVTEARKSLRQNSKAITEEINDVMAMQDVRMIDKCRATLHVASTKSARPSAIPCRPYYVLSDLKHIRNRDEIMALANIYSILIDLNTTTNVLEEITLLINMLNAYRMPFDPSYDDDFRARHRDQFHLKWNLSDGLKAVYFAVNVLRSQCEVLSQLDTNSVSVIIENERVRAMAPCVHKFLYDSYRTRQSDVEKCRQSGEQRAWGSSSSSSSLYNCVHYQEDEDSRCNFTSNAEFNNYKEQRDLFYKALKIWETNHWNPEFNFHKRVGSIIAHILDITTGDHIIDFCQLFVSQLLVSANSVIAPANVEDMDVDADKYSKLTQRMVAPSKFSVPYKFPDYQAFYRSFIYEADSIPFTEYLKLTLYTKLMSLNVPTYDMLNLKVDGAVGFNVATIDLPKEYMLRPELLSSVKVLAKFLGLVTMLPYSAKGDRNAVIRRLYKKKMTLRQQFLPTFDPSQHLKDAIRKDKIIVTIIWLVQYFVMLDDITFGLHGYAEALEIIFAIYLRLNRNHWLFYARPMLLVRCTIGWLLNNKPYITQQYYAFRHTKKAVKYASLLDQIKWMRPGVPNVMARRNVNPIFDTILNVGCSFLADFRISIMSPTQSSEKSLSRIGQYRRLTTQISTLPKGNSVSEEQNHNAEEKVVEAFVQSLPPTVGIILKSMVEQISNVIIKDAQNRIMSLQGQKAKQKMICTLSKNALDSGEMKNETAFLIKKRIDLFLRSFLADDTNISIRNAYIFYLKGEINARVNDWYTDNVDVLHVQPESIDPRKKYKKGKNEAAMRIILGDGGPSPSHMIDELQNWLHIISTANNVNDIGDKKIIDFFDSIPSIFVHTLPITYMQALSIGLIQMMQIIVNKKPTVISVELCDAFARMWTGQRLMRDLGANITSKELADEIFMNNLITVRFMYTLGDNNLCYENVNAMLMALLRNGLSVDAVLDQFLTVLKESFTSDIFNKISSILNNISLAVDADPNIYTGDGDNWEYKKTSLFLEFLADLSSTDEDF